MIIFIGPVLMVVTKVHEIDYKRIIYVPFIFCCILLFIISQQILQSELGIIDLRNDNFLNPNYRNPSFIWGPTNDAAIFIEIFTPNFFKKVPYGPFKGQEKFWPFFLDASCHFYLFFNYSLYVLFLCPKRYHK